MLRLRTMHPVVGTSGGPPTLQLTRVGAFIRNYSLDDVPGLLNVLLGDMSIVGPRPMEPDRMDLRSTEWQHIGSVRPGLISAAMLDLGRTYTLAPPETRQRMEQNYVARQSLHGDLALVMRALHGLVASRGNIKARGLPRTVKPPH